MPLLANQLKKFWSAIESIPGQSTTLTEWRNRLGTEFDLVRSLLRATGTTADMILPQGMGASGTMLCVVRHPVDGFVGISEEGDRIPLSAENVNIHQLDWVPCSKRIASALGLEPATRGGGNDRILGTHNLNGIRRPIFIVVELESEAFNHAITELLCSQDPPCVIVVPTPHRISLITRQSLQKSNGCVIALSDALAISDDGNFVSIRPPDELFAAAYAAADGKLPKADGVYSSREIVWRGVEYKCELTKSEMAFLRIGLVESEIDLHKLMHPKNGAVWKARYQRGKPAREKISQFVTRLNKKLLKTDPAIRIMFELQRGEDTIARSDPIISH